jgi:hypothetical protein
VLYTRHASREASRAGGGAQVTAKCGAADKCGIYRGYTALGAHIDATLL